MSLFKKKIYLYLYIFFLILVFIFSKFSTNLAFGKNLTVFKVEINETYDLNFNKSQVIDKAFVKAYNILIYNKYMITINHPFHELHYMVYHIIYSY